MDFVMFSAAFLLFCLGGVLAIQGFVRRDPVTRLDLDPYLRRHARETESFHAPERHPVRLTLIGLSLMVLAVVFLAVVT